MTRRPTTMDEQRRFVSPPGLALNVVNQVMRGTDVGRALARLAKSGARREGQRLQRDVAIVARDQGFSPEAEQDFRRRVQVEMTRRLQIAEETLTTFANAVRDLTRRFGR